MTVGHWILCFLFMEIEFIFKTSAKHLRLTVDNVWTFDGLIDYIGNNLQMDLWWNIYEQVLIKEASWKALLQPCIHASLWMQSSWSHFLKHMMVITTPRWNNLHSGQNEIGMVRKPRPQYSLNQGFSMPWVGSVPNTLNNNPKALTLHFSRKIGLRLFLQWAVTHWNDLTHFIWQSFVTFAHALLLMQDDWVPVWFLFLCRLKNLPYSFTKLNQMTAMWLSENQVILYKLNMNLIQ